MPYDDQFWRAVADYGDRFPTVGSLGVDAATWLAEMARIRRTAFAAVLITASGTEGGNASGVRNFPQEVLADALRCRRYDLDNTYVLPPHLARYPSAALARARGSGGATVRFGG